MLRPTAEESDQSIPSARGLALRKLFERMESHLLSYAFSLIGRRAVAEEIVQEVFLQLHAHWEKVQKPEAWLIRCVRNRALKHLQQVRREQLDGDACLDKTGSLSDSTSVIDRSPDNRTESPDAGLMRLEATLVLETMMNDLSDSDRELIDLKYYQGMKYREISERTGLSVSNVGFRLHRLLKELATRLPALGIESQP